MANRFKKWKIKYQKVKGVYAPYRIIIATRKNPPIAAQITKPRISSQCESSSKCRLGLFMVNEFKVKQKGSVTSH
jgi:hypothetical protein